MHLWVYKNSNDIVPWTELIALPYSKQEACLPRYQGERQSWLLFVILK